MSGPLYIVLDALDELSISPRNDLIPYLVDLSPEVRLFITTRPLSVEYPHISYQLDSSDPRDLTSYIHSEVESLDYALYGEQDDVSTLKELVMSKSSELFLLASLHIRELKGCLDMDDALEVAANLPTTDKTRYSRSIDRILSRDSRRATTAIHCLVWIWQARRRLTLEELQIAVASSTRDLTDRLVNRALVPRHHLLDLCDGLLVMSDRDDYIAFVHLTARQYFDEHAGPDILEILSNLGTGCLGYLNARHSSETMAKWSEEARQCSFSGDSEGRGFFDYASRFWGEHPSANIETSIAILLKNAALFDTVARLRAAEILSNQPIGDSEFAPLGNISWPHIATSFALTKYLAITADLASKVDSNGLTPLHYAVLANQQETVEELLRNGLQPNSRDCNGSSPLSIAAYNSDINIVNLLLERDDIEADSRNKYGHTPLSLSALSGCIDIVHLLLKRNDVNAGS
ncbi:hypothetical protein DL96DRAFT_882856 [Flagelloscypha sp. PMI_526]|nr:hypothetical protein DL96DRAFT_882856 [Flagelloscypha sp. PMI_526]